MKHCLLIIMLSLFVMTNSNSSEANDATAIAEAKMIAKKLGDALKKELKQSMMMGGPVNALNTCNISAMPITDNVAKESHAQVSRVSLKNRNPKNSPNDWQKFVLEDFDSRAAKGEDVAKMMFSHIDENNGKKQLRFMKALGTKDICLKCHGKQISPAVKEKLALLYPDDKAVGYVKGQVRGAIVVVKNLN